VLTDGKIYYAADGSQLKAFSTLDGFGLKMLQEAGVTVAWISGSRAPAVTRRAEDLGVAHVVLGADDKFAAWEKLRIQLGVDADACAHIGDDVPDLPVIVRCGLGATVPHAPAALRRAAHYVTLADGGAGAVRELCELILTAQGALEPLLKSFAQ
jgi:3-deoxy-D-manno-octulosonate 8-phosphate phosphatase (KDO 8-P phosphatase)